uniref:RNA-dependent RNA polymerase n=1 Tax=Statovirus F1 TaxID=2862951 RepID=A0A8F8SKM0_9VIRU|nr:RNA-dependent RNA polymerase [Statovirus F1]
MTILVLFIMVKLVITIVVHFVFSDGRVVIKEKGTHFESDGQPLEYKPNPPNHSRRAVPIARNEESQENWIQRITKHLGVSPKSVMETHFPKGKDYEGTVSDFTKICDFEPRIGFSLNELSTAADIPDIKPVMPGNENKEFERWYTKQVDGYYNQHEKTSFVKHYLTSLISELDLNTMSITYQNWLSHTGSNGSYLVCCYDTDVVNNYMQEILQTNLPGLFVLEDYHEGVHFDEEYAYYCLNGRVKAISRGSSHVWYDENTKWFLNEHGNIGETHMYRTLVRYGSQRLVLLCRGQTTEVPLVVTKVPTVTVKERPFSMPSRKCYMPALHSQIVDKEIATIPEFDADVRPLRKHSIPSVAGFIINCIQWVLTLLCFFVRPSWNLVILLIVSIPWKYTIMHKWEWTGSMFLGTLWLVYEVIRYRILPAPVNINLGFNRIYIKGKHAEPFKAHLHSNQRDQNGLPYGFYYVDRFNIIRVPPGSVENYTNLREPVATYNVACGHNPINVEAKFSELFGHSHCTNTSTLQGAVSPADISEILARLTVVDYTLEVKQRASSMYHLLSSERFSEFTCSQLTEEVAAGAASNRLLQPTPPQMEMGVYLNQMIDFWTGFRHNIDGAECFLDMEHLAPQEVPDLSHYTGKKLKRMEHGYAAHREGAFYKTFMKNEALPRENLNKKALRIITPNTPAFNAHNREFFHEFEKSLLSMTDRGERIFAKGLNYDQRFEIIENLCQEYKYVCCCDFSNFDAHHRNNSYAAELKFYELLGLSKETVWELGHARKEGNIGYQLPSRCSGDLYTGSGNCLTIAALFKGYSRELRILCDGDDTLVFTNKLSDANDLQEYMLNMGFNLKIDKVVTDFENQTVDFCQVQYDVAGGTYSIDIHRRLNKAMNFKSDSIQDAAKTIRGKIESMRALAPIGVHFRYGKEDIDYLLQYIPLTTEDAVYAYHAATGMTRLNQEQFEMIDLEEDAGLLSKICHKLTNKTILTKLVSSPVNKRSKLIHEVIEDVLEQELTRCVLEEMSCGSHTMVVGKFAVSSVQQISQLGSTEWHLCTKITKCMKLGSIGLVPIIRCQQEMSLPLTIPTPTTQSPSNPSTSLHNKEQRQNKSRKVDGSQSQDQHMSERHPKDQQEVKDHGSSISSPRSQQIQKRQSNSTSVTTSHSEHHNCPHKEMESVSPQQETKEMSQDDHSEKPKSEKKEEKPSSQYQNRSERKSESSVKPEQQKMPVDSKSTSEIPSKKQSKQQLKDSQQLSVEPKKSDKLSPPSDRSSPEMKHNGQSKEHMKQMSSMEMEKQQLDMESTKTQKNSSGSTNPDTSEKQQQSEDSTSHSQSQSPQHKEDALPLISQILSNGSVSSQSHQSVTNYDLINEVVYTYLMADDPVNAVSELLQFAVENEDINEEQYNASMDVLKGPASAGESV